MREGQAGCVEKDIFSKKFQAIGSGMADLVFIVNVDSFFIITVESKFYSFNYNLLNN